MVFATLAEANSVISGLEDAAKLVRRAKNAKDGEEKMKKVLDLLKGLQGNLLHSPHHTAAARKELAATGRGDDLAAILAGKAPM